MKVQASMARKAAQGKLAQPLPPRHVPQRTCVACRTVQPKRELVRVVRMPTGQVQVDPSGKMAGRGAYLHRDPECWKEGLRKGKLARALHIVIAPEDQAALESFTQAVLAAVAQETSGS